MESTQEKIKEIGVFTLILPAFFTVGYLVSHLLRNWLIYFSPEQCHEVISIDSFVKESPILYLTGIVLVILVILTLAILNKIFTSLSNLLLKIVPLRSFLNAIQEYILTSPTVNKVMITMGIISAIVIIVVLGHGLWLAVIDIYNFYYCIE